MDGVLRGLRWGRGGTSSSLGGGKVGRVRGGGKVVIEEIFGSGLLFPGRWGIGEHLHHLEEVKLWQ